MPPSHPGPHPCLPERRQPAGPQATRGAARRGPSPSAGPSGPRPWRSGASLPCGDRESAGGRGDSHPPPPTDPAPPEHGRHRAGVRVGQACGWSLARCRCSVHATGWADAPDIPSGSACVLSLGIPQECDESDTPMGGLFTTLSMPFLLWGPWLYSQGYSSPTQYFHV